jgi:hypothetical protein
MYFSEAFSIAESEGRERFDLILERDSLLFAKPNSTNLYLAEGSRE